MNRLTNTEHALEALRFTPEVLGKCLHITQAACTLMAADRSLTFDDAVKDVYNVLRYVMARERQQVGENVGFRPEAERFA